MKKQILLFLKFKILFVLIISSPLIGCTRAKPKSFNVTYKVSILSRLKTKICIIYKDHDDYHAFHTEEKEWSKEIQLSPDDKMASLLVTIVHVEDDDLYGISPEPKIKGSIIHQDKIVEEMNSTLLTIHLFNPNFSNR